MWDAGSARGASTSDASCQVRVAPPILGAAAARRRGWAEPPSGDGAVSGDAGTDMSIATGTRLRRLLYSTGTRPSAVGDSTNARPRSSRPPLVVSDATAAGATTAPGVVRGRRCAG